jgi:hypothetical protein
LTTLSDDIELLSNSRSVKRKSAAKRLRKKADIFAGPFLLSRLKIEVQDTRTWETQYQLIMAIGECEYLEALPFLENLSTQTLEATMVYVGIGDALVRLQQQGHENIAPVFTLMKSGNEMLIDGGLRAMAMLKMVPSDDDIQKILNFASKFNNEHGIRFWPLAASAGWSGKHVEKYISQCAKSKREDLQTAAKFALEKRYYNWNPL